MGQQTGKTAAFFDLDNTIISGVNSMFLYVRYLVKKKELSPLYLAKGVVYGALHKLDLINIEKLTDEFTIGHKGKNHDDLERMAESWFHTDVARHISPKAKEKIEFHRKQNHIICLLSSSTQYVCLPVVNHLNMDASINSIVEVKNGKLTGLMKKPLCYKEGKVFYSKLFAEKNDIDLKKSCFYTDSITDLPMMKEVGFPVAVNPDPLLRMEAKKHGWPVEIWSPPNRGPRLKRYLSIIKGQKSSEGFPEQPK